MTNKEVIMIDGYTIKDLKDLLFTGQKMAISTKTFEAIIDELQRKEQENKLLSENLRIKEDEARHYLEETTKYRKLAADFKDINKQLGYKYLTIQQVNEESKKNLKYEKELCKKYIDSRYEYILENDQLKAENERLKEFVSGAKEAPICFQCKEENCIRKERDSYKQALERVKNICEPINCKNPEECYVNKPDDYGEIYGCEPDDWEEPKQLTRCPSAVARAILQTIDEVLKDEE